MKNILSDLNEVQRSAASVIDGPILIIAGAGSGKTRVLSYRIANLIQSGVSPDSILSLTFTNKASEEMKERIKKVLNVKNVPIWAGTFHSIFAKILRREAEQIGYKKNFTIYDTDDAKSVVKKIMNEKNISTQQFSSDSICRRISYAKNQMISPSEFEEKSKFGIDAVAAKIYPEYQNYLLNCNSMDFDDLLLNLIKLFSKNKNILDNYQERFKYILVDEYQDTNRAQYEAINMLAAKYKNICVVGDDAQSIYAFRGADIRNILDFERDYPKAKTFRLEQNYRSTKSILAIADSLIKYNRNQIKKNLWTDNPKGEVVSIYNSFDERDEAKYVVKNILSQMNSNNYMLNDFVVLYRTNAQSRVLEDELRRNAIAYKIIGGVVFYQRKEIKDLLAYFRLLVNSEDNVSFLRVINFPTRGIGTVSLNKFIQLAKEQIWGEVSYLSALNDENILNQFPEKVKASFISFKIIVEKYKNLLSQMSFNEVVRLLVDEIGILKLLKDEATPESIARWQNILELLNAVTEFCETKPEPTLEKFLEEVALISAVDKLDEKKNSVTLMTLHATKGLEFKNVFVVGLEEGLLPMSQTMPSPEEVEEERRLFYVGITRAMEKLFLTHAKQRMRMGETSFANPSRFLDEIDKKYIVEEKSKHEFVPRRIFKSERKTKETHFDYESESQEDKNFRVGAIVEHDAFGRGKVTHLVGRGENAKAVVWFEEIGQKNLMLKYAPMRIVE